MLAKQRSFLPSFGRKKDESDNFQVVDGGSVATASIADLNIPEYEMDVESPNGKTKSDSPKLSLKARIKKAMSPSKKSKSNIADAPSLDDLEECTERDDESPDGVQNEAPASPKEDVDRSGHSESAYSGFSAPASPGRARRESSSKKLNRMVSSPNLGSTTRKPKNTMKSQKSSARLTSSGSDSPRRRTASPSRGGRPSPGKKRVNGGLKRGVSKRIPSSETKEKPTKGVSEPGLLVDLEMELENFREAASSELEEAKRQSIESDKVSVAPAREKVLAKAHSVMHFQTSSSLGASDTEGSENSGNDDDGFGSDYQNEKLPSTPKRRGRRRQARELLSPEKRSMLLNAFDKGDLEECSVKVSSSSQSKRSGTGSPRRKLIGVKRQIKKKPASNAEASDDSGPLEAKSILEDNGSVSAEQSTSDKPDGEGDASAEASENATPSEAPQPKRRGRRSLRDEKGSLRSKTPTGTRTRVTRSKSLTHKSRSSDKPQSSEVSHLVSPRRRSRYGSAGSQAANQKLGSDSTSSELKKLSMADLSETTTPRSLNKVIHSTKKKKLVTANILSKKDCLEIFSLSKHLKTRRILS